ncbi:MAG TPA: helix-hairpin-helix domain-containing protein [Acidobacteriaceae bacterium]|jgi:DNA uptake protein ComE-like DNA-binding protein|nr:helix-hairpin-helix domain-containing protein [Acidobacteriaceae bacterium]
MKLSGPQSLVSVLSLALVLAGIVACDTKDNPDEIRRRTADATESVRRDAKAMAEGVKEGMGRQKTLNINKASREELLDLPGISEHQADRIIAGRPFDNADDLVKRHILSDTEYDKIRDRVIAGH